MNINTLAKSSFIILQLLFICACKTDSKSDALSPTIIESNDTLIILDSLIQADVRNPDLYFDRAVYFKNKGLFPKAKADIYSALFIDSLNADFYMFAGDLFVDMGVGANAAALMSKGINRGKMSNMDNRSKRRKGRTGRNGRNRSKGSMVVV